ncbi:hypothetical protein B6D60_05440 [candidate division KSB1 bacterium 4484_87]|nr:MAG: hypothetical protein B6D60_05440 [candidate division KSB1 bacterium 4484_87]
MLVEISVVVIAVFIVIFVIGLLIALVQIRRTAREAEKLMEVTRQQIVPISHDLTIVVNDVKRIVQSVQKQVGMVEQGVGNIKETVARITQIERTLNERVSQPFVEFATLLSAVSRALRTFFEFMRK